MQHRSSSPRRPDVRTSRFTKQEDFRCYAQFSSSGNGWQKSTIAGTLRSMRGLLGFLGIVGFVCGCSAAATSEEPGSGAGTGNGGTGTGGGIGLGGSGAGIGIGGGGSGTGGFSGGSCAGVTQQANNTQLPADVIWAIDTSPSMTEETAAVQANMNKFSQLIANAGIDVRNILLAEEFSPSPVPGFIPDEGICIAPPLGSGACPADTNFPNFLHVFQTVASTNALSLFLSTYPTYKPSLRPNSIKIFTVVTDDNSSLPAQGFIDQLVQLDPATIKPNQWKMYGVFCFFDCLSAAEPGSVYNELVNLTGGIASDLCLQNFDPVFNQLAQGIIGSAKLDCGWVIPDPPPGETFNKSKVNVIFTPGGGTGAPIGKVGSAAECGANGGWYYDDESNPSSVHVCPSSCQVIQSDPNGKIDVQFGCDTVRVPK